jgi:hypothetical protein
MSRTPFTDLSTALVRSADWSTIRRAWDDSEGLLAALMQRVPAGLARQVMQVRRSDPAKGIRGSQVVVVARSTAAAAKLRLQLADWDNELRAAGWGVSEVVITACRHQSIHVEVVPGAARAPIPPSVRTQLLGLAADLPDGPLHEALHRLASRIAGR